LRLGRATSFVVNTLDEKKTPPPVAEGLLGGKISKRLLRCDSGEHVILSALDEQKDIILVFGLL
jgi:mRNA-degrading endonuclease RelE of RelBE toxin-antitoxin system